MDITNLLNFYKKQAVNFISKYKADNITDFNKHCARLETACDTRGEPVHACFLGTSGIGKSTLLNALIAKDKTVLPAGGIGPLTAQAITVRYSDKSSFKAEYHDMGRINRLKFALESFYHSKTREMQKSAEITTDEMSVLEEDFKHEVADIISGEADDLKNEKRENYIKQARLMITNNQNSDRELPYLIDGLQMIVGKQLLFDSKLSDEDLKRVDQIQNALNKGYSEYTEDDLNLYEEMKCSHAAGYFAPIIRKLEVNWKSDLLRTGLVLVDLPGVGIMGDIYKEVTSTYLREKAKAVILVVSTRGVTEADAAVLRESGFMNRLLYSVDDPSSDLVSLIVAVTRVDDVAEARYRNDVNREKKKWQHLADVCSETEIDVKAQLMSQLRKEWNENADQSNEQKRKVLNRIEDSLQVIPLSAIEYSKYYADDEDDRPFIKELAQSNIPKMEIYLSEIVGAIAEERNRRLEEHSRQFALSLINQIDIIEAEWLSDERSSEAQDLLERNLEEFMQPLRYEYKSREGAFRNYLKKTIPVQIESLVNTACSTSMTSINRYLGTLKGAHWGTLRASVRRGGTYYGARNIDLPNDFALKFEEPIAEIWGKALLQDIRKETRQFAVDCTCLVDQVVAWSISQGTGISAKAIEAHQEKIKLDAKDMNMVGKEALEELRKSVIEKMITRVKGPIRRKCDAFVNRGDAMGPGVKNRILDLFSELSNEAVSAAKEPATELILERYRDVEREILTSFRKIEDPLKSIADTILGTHRKNLARRDKKAKEALLQDVAFVRGNMPKEMHNMLQQNPK